MGIETTKTVRRSNAIKMLQEKDKDFSKSILNISGNEILSKYLYTYSSNIFENYIVVNDDYKIQSHDIEKTDWDD